MNSSSSSGLRPGWLLLLLGLLFNRWTLGWVLAPDGVIESGLFRGLIHVIDGGLILAGLALLKLDVSYPDILRGVRRTTARCRDWIFSRSGGGRPSGTRMRRLLTPILPWLLLAFILIAAEGLAYLALLVKSPDLAKNTVRRHAVIGSPKQLLPGDVHEREVIALHPLYGWYHRRETRHRDRYGFRVNEPSDTFALDPSSELRIFLLGGSTAAGHGVPPDQTVAAHLERLLERDGTKNVNVVNAGVGGWASTQELALLVQRVLPFFDPDAVIVLDGANDVKRAAVSGRRLRRSGSKRNGPWISRNASYLHDPKLEFYRDQFEALEEHPLHVLNQLLYALGIRRYLHPENYFAGRWIGASLSPGPRGRTVFDRKIRAINRMAPVEMTKRQRRRSRKRIRSLPRRQQKALRRTLERLPARDAAIFRKMTGGSPPDEWQQFRNDLPESPDGLDELVKYVIAPFQPEKVGSWLNSLPCAPVPVDVKPYLGNVRSAVQASGSFDVPIVYALQPTLFHKQHRTFAERLRMRNMRTCLYSGRCFPRFEFPFGTCLRRLFRRFHRKAGRAFRSGRFTAEPEASARVVDLSRLFADDRRHMFTDYVHYNGRANRTIARRLERILTEMDVTVISRSPSSDPPRWTEASRAGNDEASGVSVR